MSLRVSSAWLAAAVVAALVGCSQEERRFRESPAAAQLHSISLSELHPGLARPPPPAKNPYEGNAWALAEGRRLYRAFNCVGCHFNGAGGIGPALMDQQWIYGSQPAQIFSTIIEGRPNGMPSFRGHLNDQQVWQIVAYVRSLSNLAETGDTPGRSPSDGGGSKKSGGQKKSTGE